MPGPVPAYAARPPKLLSPDEERFVRGLLPVLEKRGQDCGALPGDAKRIVDALMGLPEIPAVNIFDDEAEPASIDAGPPFDDMPGDGKALRRMAAIPKAGLAAVDPEMPRLPIHIFAFSPWFEDALRDVFKARFQEWTAFAIGPASKPVESEIAVLAAALREACRGEALRRRMDALVFGRPEYAPWARECRAWLEPYFYR